MSDFEADHPRGQAANPGQFRAKDNDAPTGELTDRAARMAEADRLRGERNEAARSRSSDSREIIRDLDKRIASLYGRADRKTAPLGNLHLEAMNRSVDHYIVHDSDDYNTGRPDIFDLNPPYQRGTVWTLEQRQRLIESFLSGIPIGSVTVNNRWAVNGYQGPVGYAVVDGKQRIETVRAFVADEFAVPADWFEDEDIADENPDGTILFSQLTKRGQFGVHNWTIPTQEARLATVEDEARLFILLNSGGTAQTAADLDRAADVAGD